VAAPPRPRRRSNAWGGCVARAGEEQEVVEEVVEEDAEAMGEEKDEELEEDAQLDEAQEQVLVKLQTLQEELEKVRGTSPWSNAGAPHRSCIRLKMQPS
jgi:hypothetical protein